jgi:hypothetical protein
MIIKLANAMSHFYLIFLFLALADLCKMGCIWHTAY